MLSSTKRLLFLTHRWLGIILCAFFAMWFFSGVVMMYVGYPKLTDAERLQHLPPIAAQGLLAPHQAMRRAGLHEPLKELRLAQLGARPVYFALPLAAADQAALAIDARSGARLPAAGQASALASAAAYAGSGPGTAPGLRYLDMIDADAFTHSKALDRHRPLHRVQLLDAEATLLYISSRSGEVVRDAGRSERLWNYAGAWIHWLYPFRGNLFDPYWRDIVNYLSIAGIAMAVSGTIVGILRWRFRQRNRSGARTPYAGRAMRWHHIGGLLFAVVTITWIFSGLMSMNPWRVFDSGAAKPRMAALEGGALVMTPHDAAPAALLASNGDGDEVKAETQIRELRWTRVLGRTIALAYPATGKPWLIDSRQGRRVALDEAALLAAAAGLLPHPVARLERLDHYDLHYYARADHSMTGGADKPLPVLRLVFADPHATWITLDAHTGAVLARSDRHKRASRWLFAMLHSWDWLPLLERRPLWDALLILLSAGGLLMSVTGIIIGWRRLGRKLRATNVSSGRTAMKKRAIF